MSGEQLTSKDLNEPRVELNEVFVKENPDDNQFDVQIQYYIVGIDVPPQELSFALEPTR